MSASIGRTRTLRYAINVTLDGCVDHREGMPTEDLHRWSTASVARADAMLMGRDTYALMADAWRPPVSPDFPDWMLPFARAIDETPKIVVSRSDDALGWNGRIVRGDLARIVDELPQGDILLGGVTLPTALAALGLVEVYEFVSHPTIAGHGPYLLAGLPRPLDLEPVGREELASGLVVSTFVRRR